MRKSPSLRKKVAQQRKHTAKAGSSRSVHRSKAGVTIDASASDAEVQAEARILGAAPPILIEIDPAVSGGYVENRFDIMIRGRVVSLDPINEVRLEVDHSVNSASFYGQPRRHADCVFPDGRPARQLVFQFNLPRSGDTRTDRCKFQIIARTDEDLEQTADFEIELDHAKDQPILVVSGSICPGAALGNPPPQVIMYVESATITQDGILSVNGWATAFGRVVAVQIFNGSFRVGEARIGQEREDVAAVHRAYPNARSSGFSFTTRLDVPNRTAEAVRVRLLCLDGYAHEETIPVRHLDWQSIQQHQFGNEEFDALAAQAWRRPANEVEMYCDEAQLSSDGILFVNGWAVCASGIAQVRVVFDDQDVGLAAFGHERVDVGRAFPEVPMAHLAGFRFESNIGPHSASEHTVRVVVRGGQGDENQKQVAVVAIERTGPTTPVSSPIEQPTAPSPEFRFELDSPALLNGAPVEPVTGRLTIEGWLLTRSGVANFDVWLDDQRLGDAHFGLARQDVGAAFPDWPHALRSGFAFHCPPRSLRDGEHTIKLAVRANSGLEMERSFRVVIKKSDENSDNLAIRRRIPRVEADMLLAYLAEVDHRPVFRLVLRQNQSININDLRVTLKALRLQAYAEWTLTILAENANVANRLAVVIGDLEPRLADRSLILGPQDAAQWNTPLARDEKGKTELYALLLPGDEPGADALLELAAASGRHRADLLYGDEVRDSPVSQHKEPFFKPNFSPDLLLSTNYIGRLWVVTSVLLAKTGVTPAGLAATGEYDLLLRCAELATGVHHVPKLLCHRGAVALDDPELEQKALADALDRRGIVGEILATPIPATWRLRRALPEKSKVSIIIPTCAANGYIETCINTLRAKTSYPDYEIISIDNIAQTETVWKDWLRENSDKIVDIPGAFNWSGFNNQAAQVATGQYLLFLNDDIEVTQDDWLDALVEHAQRPEVGVVGPQLLYRNGKVQHAGMFLSNGIGRHAFRFAAKDDPCYFGLALTQRNVIAVTGACMLMRRETFEQLGRFDEAHEIINNDLDFCLRAHRAGLLTVYTPYATLIHHELASRAHMKDSFDLAYFNATWKTTFAAGDPYFNPRLNRNAEDYRPDDEPVQWAVAGAPLFHVNEIERVLVIKLDHIGDFVTALPPIRRLREIFPQAQITVLAGLASRDFISLEPCIDEFIPFSFFHSRSQLGERQLTTEDYSALADQLGPHRFDLAIDLRKHPSTRDVLRYTGARFLAGFDYLGQFPFLDIALDWDGDRNLQRKRSHIVDDLLALVNAVGHATKNDRLLMQPGPSPMPLTELPAPVRALFRKPVVAIHPGAGNITKQWPEEHFSALIDILIERNNVNIVLVGGPDDVGISKNLLQSILHTKNIASMAGKTTLANLSRLLKNCVLYIGNDSGPKHIAAAVGIPTIGIHSGVVDPVEWGPIGPKAVALRRNMTCSPCYLANAKDCPRSLACLRFLEPSLVYETADLLLQGRQPVESQALPTLDEPVARSQPRLRRKSQPKPRQAVIEPV